jgi:hypothetical protein
MNVKINSIEPYRVETTSRYTFQQTGGRTYRTVSINVSYTIFDGDDPKLVSECRLPPNTELNTNQIKEQILDYYNKLSNNLI